jgi:glucose-6-phosphate 1-dehydrogenase
MKEFFVTKDEIINSWKIFDHIIKNWNGTVETYEKGSEYAKLV